MRGLIMSTDNTRPGPAATAFARAFGSRTEPLALYGTSPATSEILEAGPTRNVVGILDGTRTEGTFDGIPILTLAQVPRLGIYGIVIVARAASTHTVARRISEFCRKHGIALFDVHGRDLLGPDAVTHVETPCPDLTTFSTALRDFDVVTFDVFDTLLTRTVLDPTDVFDLVAERLRGRVSEPLRSSFAGSRRAAEAELLATGPYPTLDQIYDELARRSGFTSSETELCRRLEIDVETEVLTPRESVRNLFEALLGEGKTIYLVSDMYLPAETIESLLTGHGITGWSRIFVSNEYGVTKPQGLFTHVTEGLDAASVAHVGDSFDADVAAACEAGVTPFHIPNGRAMFAASPCAAVIPEPRTLLERLILGHFVAEAFNDPFSATAEDRRVRLRGPGHLAITLFTPLIAVLTLWLVHEVRLRPLDGVLFLSRDGHLVKRLVDFYVSREELSWPPTMYFHASRTAYLGAGLRTRDDVERLLRIEFSGSLPELLRARLPAGAVDTAELAPGAELKCVLDEYTEDILAASKRRSEAFRRYAAEHGVRTQHRYGVFDFFASGTCQRTLADVLGLDVEGFYAGRLATASHDGSDIAVTSLFDVRDSYAGNFFVDHAFILLEDVMTSPEGSLKDFSDAGSPILGPDDRDPETVDDIVVMHEAIANAWERLSRLVSPDMLPMAAGARAMADAIFSTLRAEYSTAHDLPGVTRQVRDEFFHRQYDLGELV